MSSITTEGSLTASTPLIVGTPEHEAYYYDRLEKSMYNYINEAIELCPDILMCRTWVSLGDTGQKAIMDRVKGICKYGQCRFDIEDQGRVDRLMSTLLGGFLIDISPPESEQQRSTGSNYGQNRVKNDLLLKEQDRQRKLNSKNGKKKGESNRLLKTAITRSQIQRAQMSPNSSNPV